MLERTIAAAEGTPSLLLHSCCAPCSSYVLEYLSRYFKITVFYYNPNIYPPEEFFKRRSEQERFIALLHAENPISFMGAEFESESFYSAVKGLENIPEGGERCFACYRLRLEKTAALAKEKGFDYFTTTLSISPHKNAEMLNSIGGELGEKYGVSYLFSDFKKKNGYKRSTELSRLYGIYRQNYCGCVFSMREAERRANEKSGHNNYVPDDAPVIETPRLYMRKMNGGDYDSLCAMLKDKETMYAYEHGFSDEEVREWLEKQLDRYEKYGFGLWAVILKENGDMIGQCGITMQESPLGQLPEIGYIFRRDMWHKGYASEAAGACKKYAFEVMGFDKIYSIIRENNLPSVKVAQRNGMVPVGTFTKHYYGMDMPHIIYSAERI